MEESEFELGEFRLHENLFNPREHEDRHQDRDHLRSSNHQDHGETLTEDHETVVKIEESGEPGQNRSVGPWSVEPSFVQSSVQESEMVTFKSEDQNVFAPNPSIMAFPGIPGPSTYPQIQLPGNGGFVPMYQGVVKLSFGREIILGPSKKFGTKNQTSYRIVTLSKYECDVCQFSYVGENVNKLKGMDKSGIHVRVRI